MRKAAHVMAKLYKYMTYAHCRTELTFHVLVVVSVVMVVIVLVVGVSLVNMLLQLEFVLGLL